MNQYSVLCFTRNNPNAGILIADNLPTPASARNIAKCLLAIPNTQITKTEIWVAQKTPGHKIVTYFREEDGDEGHSPKTYLESNCNPV